MNDKLIEWIKSRINDEEVWIDTLRINDICDTYGVSFHSGIREGFTEVLNYINEENSNDMGLREIVIEIKRRFLFWYKYNIYSIPAIKRFWCWIMRY